VGSDQPESRHPRRIRRPGVLDQQPDREKQPFGDPRVLELHHLIPEFVDELTRPVRVRPHSALPAKQPLGSPLGARKEPQLRHDLAHRLHILVFDRLDRLQHRSQFDRLVHRQHGLPRFPTPHPCSTLNSRV
jgi:hypothetical protein